MRKEKDRKRVKRGYVTENDNVVSDERKEIVKGYIYKRRKLLPLFFTLNSLNSTPCLRNPYLSKGHNNIMDECCQVPPDSRMVKEGGLPWAGLENCLLHQLGTLHYHTLTQMRLERRKRG